jgi:hypothetical protein
MKKESLLSEILSAIVNHERDKAKSEKPDYFLNQKKQLWYGLMNRVDEDEKKEGE